MLESRRTGGIAPEVTLPDDESRWGLRVAPERREEGGDLRRVVLAVGVERDDGLRAERQGMPEAGSKRGALALVRRLTDHGRSGDLGLGNGVVSGAVVDDDDRQVLASRHRRRVRSAAPPGRPGIRATIVSIDQPYKDAPGPLSFVRGLPAVHCVSTGRVYCSDVRTGIPFAGRSALTDGHWSQPSCTHRRRRPQSVPNCSEP